jgi:multiple sugar transport system substrate-binding protein
MPEISRRTLLAGAGTAALVAMAGGAHAQDAVSGELVVLNWLGGSEADMMKTVQAGFLKKYPDVKIREVLITGQGDMRGGIRTALMGGEVVDVLINTWPAFRKELLDAGMLRPVDDQWKSFGWDKVISQSWKDLGAIDGKTYGLTYTFGDRSGIW